MLQRIDYPELFFGLVAPIGIDLSDTLRQLSDALKVFGYETIPIKVTDIFREIDFCDAELTEKPIEDRFRSYIDFGNRVRELTADQAICAALAIDKITKLRQKDAEGKPVAEEQKAFIIHQFKRKEEIDLLRSVYGRLFFFKSPSIRLEVSVQMHLHNGLRVIIKVPTSNVTSLKPISSLNSMRTKRTINLVNEYATFFTSPIL
jgi:hypothetical protein